MPEVSIVINCDTRSERNTIDGLFNGTVNEDYLTDGVFNKIKFFKGFDIEPIVFIDEHNPVSQSTLDYLRAIADTVVVRKHTKEEKFNDNNYCAALSLARGKYIAHFDQDSMAFTSTENYVRGLLNLLEQYDYISYPSHCSPDPVHDVNYDYFWASTRFFLCKRETLDLTEIKKCLSDSDYLYGKYPASVRNPWFEHVAGLMAKYNGKGVFYPPMDINNYAIWSWASYNKYTIRRLNEIPYNEIINFINQHGGIVYPNDIHL